MTSTQETRDRLELAARDHRHSSSDPAAGTADDELERGVPKR